MQTNQVLTTTGSLTEINDRLRSRYLDRLGHRVRKLRKLLVERKWEDLRCEAGQIVVSGERFGFNSLIDSAEGVRVSIPSGKIPKAATPLRAKEKTEGLIVAINAVLVEDSLHRARRGLRV